MNKIINSKEVLKLMLLILIISLLLIFLTPISLLGILLSGLIAGKFHIIGDFWKSGMIVLPYLIVTILSIVLIKNWRTWLLSFPVQVIVYYCILYFQYDAIFSPWLIGIMLIQTVVVGAKALGQWWIKRKNRGRTIA